MEQPPQHQQSPQPMDTARQPKKLWRIFDVLFTIALVAAVLGDEFTLQYLASHLDFGSEQQSILDALEVAGAIGIIGLVVLLAFFGYKITGRKKYILLGLFGISPFLSFFSWFILRKKFKEYRLRSVASNKVLE